MLSTGKTVCNRPLSLSISEMITIILLFQQSCYRHFKGFYKRHVCVQLNHDFPKLISYTRFIQLMPRVLVYLIPLLNSLRAQVSGISFMDSTSISVCKNKRINRHKVFRGLATRGKTTMGWFFGFKLHLVVNDRGELISWALSQGHVDDRVPVPALCADLFGKLFADKGYVSQFLTELLLKQGTQLITSIRSNMKPRLMPLLDRLLLRKRFIIETINDQLKNISQIEHSRHRSLLNLIVNLVAGLIAYQLQPKKPSLGFSHHNLTLVS